MRHREGIRAVVFDIGNVLIDVQMRAAMEHWAAVLAMPADSLIQRLREDKTYRNLERGEITAEQFRARCGEVFGRELAAEDFQAGWNGVFCGIVDGMERLLDRLAGRVRLVLLSNTNALHVAAFEPEYEALLSRFERRFYSHELGARKPEPEAFAPVLAYLEMPPGQVAFVDDRPENVQAAEQAGMRGVVFRDAARASEVLEAMLAGVPR